MKNLSTTSRKWEIIIWMMRIDTLYPRYLRLLNLEGLVNVVPNLGVTFNPWTNASQPKAKNPKPDKRFTHVY